MFVLQKQQRIIFSHFNEICDSLKIHLIS